MSELKIKCSVCESVLTPPADVFVPEDTPRIEYVVCYKKCCNVFDSHREQQELIPSWLPCTLIVRGHSQPGCVIEKVVQKMKEANEPLQVVVNMPHNTSVDELRQFSGEAVRLTFGILDLEFGGESV